MFTNCLEGLIIDDYFSLSFEERGFSVEQMSAPSSARVPRPGLLRSTKKDIQAARVAKVGGAELHASYQPRAKCLSLAAVTLALCSSPCTSDCLHLCLMGGWTSVLLYAEGRSWLCSPTKACILVKGSEVKPGRPRVIPLLRSVADELVTITALAPHCLLGHFGPAAPHVSTRRRRLLLWSRLRVIPCPACTLAFG